MGDFFCRVPDDLTQIRNRKGKKSHLLTKIQQKSLPILPDLCFIPM